MGPPISEELGNPMTDQFSDYNPPCDFSLDAKELPDDLEPRSCGKESSQNFGDLYCWWHTEDDKKLIVDPRYLDRIYFERIDAPHLSGLELKNSIPFRSSQLYKADFSDATLRGADFFHADVRKADFSGAVLRNADFRYADISNANFENADIHGANFRKSRVVNTDFNKVNDHTFHRYFLKARVKAQTLMATARRRISATYSSLRQLASKGNVQKATGITSLFLILEITVRLTTLFTGSTQVSQFHQVAWAFIPLATDLSTSLTAFLIAGVAILAAVEIQPNEEENDLIPAFKDGVYFAISASVLGIFIQSLQQYLTVSTALCTEIGTCLRLSFFLIFFYTFLLIFIGMVLTAKDVVDLVIDLNS